MAGTTRWAMKLVLASTVLAGGGGGAYYYTSGQLPAVLIHPFKSIQSPLGSEAKAAPAANLDAVASAWGESAKEDADAVMTPEARSAAVTLARADAKSESSLTLPKKRDRYAVEETEVAEPATLAREPVAENNATDSTDGIVSNEQPTESIVADKSHEPDLATPAEQGGDAIARGQQPSEADESATVSPAGIQSIGSSADAEKSFRASERAADTSASAARARAAFRDTAGNAAAVGTGTTAHAGTAAAITPSAGTSPSGRYGSPPGSFSPMTTAAGSASASESSAANPALVNPFVAAPAASGTAAALASRSEAPRSFEDSLPPNGASPLEARPAAGASISAEPARTATSTFGAAADGYPSGAHSPSPSAYGAAAGRTPIGSTSGAQNTYGPGGPANTGMEGTGKPGERTLEGPQRPSLAIQKVAPQEIQVGKPAKFVLQVRNVGAQVADDVTIRDEIPQGTKLVSTMPTAESDGTHLVWQLGKLSAGEEKTIEIQLMPVSEGEIGSVASVTYSAQASVKTRCTMPQLAIRMTAPAQVMIGGEERVKIELRNPGSGDATNVMLFENIPQNVKHPAGPALEFEIGTLRAGETRELELVLTAEKAGKVTNVLSARADGNLQVQQQVEFDILAPALSVAVHGPERRYLERPATYEVSVENPGTAVAHDVQIVTKLPKGLQFIKANNMGEYDAATHAVYWSLAELPPGEKDCKVELVAMPTETGPQTLQVEGRAQQGLTDQTQQQILIEGLAAIMFEVRDLVDPIEVGGETGYEIRVVNQGTKAATNLRVSVNLSPGMQVISAEGETKHTAKGTSVVFDPLPQLAPKADTLFKLKVQGIQPGDQRVTVEVNTDDLGQPIRREESTRVFGDE